MNVFRPAIWVLVCFGVLMTSGTFGQAKRKSKPLTPSKTDSRVGMEIVTFGGAADVLPGYLYKPVGKGPFPAVIFLTDFKKPLAQSGPASQFDDLAKFWTSSGYILFIPDHKFRPVLQKDAAGEENIPSVNADELYMQNLYSMHKDVVAATDWLRAQAFTDDSRIVLAGTMLGGTQAIIAAEKGLNVSAIIAFSPGAISWNKYPTLQAALRRGMRNSKVPIYLMQTQNDKSLSPTAILGQELMTKGAPNRTKVFPPFGTSNNDARAFAVQGCAFWGEEAISFLDQVLPLLANASGK